MSAVQNNEIVAFPKTRLRGEKVGAETLHVKLSDECLALLRNLAAMNDAVTGFPGWLRLPFYLALLALLAVYAIAGALWLVVSCTAEAGWDWLWGRVVE